MIDYKNPKRGLRRLQFQAQLLAHRFDVANLEAVSRAFDDAEARLREWTR